MAIIVPEGTGEYASKTYRRLFDLHRALGPSGGGVNGGMASGSHRGGCGSYAVFLPLVGVLAVHPEEGGKGKSSLKI